MTKPLIGITTYRKPGERKYVFVSVAETYVNAVMQAGALPVLIYLGLPPEDLAHLRKMLDGILLTGGGDIAPHLYGAPEHLQIGGVDLDRDHTEIQLTREAVEDGMPFLGICRGLQVVNVALGGTLYADIGEQVPGALRHDYQRHTPQQMLPTALVHPVQVKEESRLAKILGRPLLDVNSLHHQGIRDLAPGFTPTAHAPDGIIEATELERHPYGISVQWHPEWLTDLAPMRALFASFVRAAANGSK